MKSSIKTTSSVANQRRCRRVGTSTLAKIECRKGALGLGLSLLVRPLDISETGIRLLLKKPVAPGDEMELVLQGGGLLRPLKRIGEVMWAIPLIDGCCCVGLSFQKNVPYRDVQALARTLH